MRKSKKPVLALALVMSLFACSHAKTQTDRAATAEPTATQALGEAKFTSRMNMDEYLKTIALPKMASSHLVHQCFLNNPKATKKELARGNLSYRFEVKLVADENQVIVDQVYLSSFKNYPKWAKPCLIEGYKKFTFPPFPDASAKSTSAFGEVNMTWKP
jgi:hypothetical protein